MDFRSVPQISRGAKFAFAVIACGVLCLLFPVAAPLFASFFLAWLSRGWSYQVCRIFVRPLLYGATLFLGFTLGALLGVDIVLIPGASYWPWGCYP